MPSLRDILVTTPMGHQIPLQQLASLAYTSGPPSIKSENARPNAWVYVDIESDHDLGSYLESARQAVEREVDVPTGYSLTWSGQFESMQRVDERLRVLVPLTLVIVFMVLLLNSRSWLTALFVLAGLPCAASGSVALLALLDYNLSVATWVGCIALAGLYAETAIVFWFYLDNSCAEYRKRGRLTTRGDLIEAIRDGATSRVRPIAMTVATDILGLVPIMVSTGTGADLMKRIATPLFGGVATSAFLVLLVFPVLYYFRSARSLPAEARTAPHREVIP